MSPVKPIAADPGVPGAASTRSLVRDLVSSHERFPSLFNDRSHPMALLTLDGELVCVNAATLDLIGCSAQRLLGLEYRTLIEGRARRALERAFVSAVAGRSASATFRLARAAGREVHLEATLFAARSDENVAGVYVACEDITLRRRNDATYREQSQRMRELYFLATSTGQTAESQIEAALELGRRRLGCDGAYLGRIDRDTVTDVRSIGPLAPREGLPRCLPGSLDAFVVDAGRPVALDDTSAAQGRYGPGAFIGAPVVIGGDDFGIVGFTHSTSREASFDAADCDFVRLVAALAASAIERGQQRRRLDTLAFFDVLTGLPNRALLADRIGLAVATAMRHDRLFALHFYDLDGFKAINDRYGHLAGDDVLRAVGKRFESIARDEDTVARVGGDEFVVVQPDVGGRADAEALAERLRAALAEPFVIGGTEHRLTASAGIALFPED
ncbi:MAG: diguanylate cyclase, partial [Candidatus Eremiobacteraeota bacterium]|nr:diguanylate cyclase [Candidatus Eremiobacteraeota bacterium]